MFCQSPLLTVRLVCVAKSTEKAQLELGTHCMQQHGKLHVTVFAPKLMAKSITYPEQLNLKIQFLRISS